MRYEFSAKDPVAGSAYNMIDEITDWRRDNDEYPGNLPKAS
jgi:hypothetical protein